MSTLLFCLPHAGGGSHQYLPWRAHLPRDIDWVPLDYPGHFSRADEALAGSLDALARTMAGEMLAMADGRPFALFGHSMGGAVAFEAARHMPGALRMLMISSAPPPHHGDNTAHAHFRLDDAAFIRHLRASGGLSAAAAANPALLRMVLPLIRHDYRLYHAHRLAAACPPLELPLKAFWGTEETALAALMPGWAAYSRAFLPGTGYPGAHFYWQTAISTLAGDLSAHARHYAASPRSSFRA